jgi:hypothetical protein
VNPEPGTGNNAQELASEPEMAPGGLSEWGLSTWYALCAKHLPALHEQVTLLRAIKWWCLADELLDEATLLAGRERAAKLKAAGDASTVALRHWRVLHFPTDETEESAKIGRPSGPSWDRIGKQAQAMKLRAAAAARRQRDGEDEQQ